MQDAANQRQLAYWNEQAGPRWVRLQERLDAQLEPLGRAALEAAALLPGFRVLDVGCGCGASSRDAARQVGPEGRVLGVDLSAPMLARARELAAGTAGLSFLQADAQNHAFERAGFDAVVSRFGVMFFESPEAAFENLRAALAAGGRLSFVCWQELARNVWMAAPMGAVARHVALPPPAEPGAPGPFAFADAGRVEGILAGAGFASIRIEPLEGELSLGGARTAEEAAAFLLEIGPAGQALREAGADAALRARVADAAAEALAPFVGKATVAAPFAAWLVRADAPGR